MKIGQRFVWGLVGAFVLASSLAVGVQQPPLEDELETAKGLYRNGKFAEAVVMLQSVVEGLSPFRDLHVRRLQLADACLHLALSHLALGDRDGAKQSFKDMLRVDPGGSLDPGVYAASVITIFEEVKSEATAELQPPLSASAGRGQDPTKGSLEKAKSRSHRTKVVLGSAGLAVAGAALILSGTGDSGFTVTCAPSALVLETGATTTCTVRSAEDVAITVSLACSGLPAGIPCRFDPVTLPLPPKASLASNLILGAPLTAREGAYSFQATGTRGSTVRTFTLGLTVAGTCSGFTERPSNSVEECRNRPPNTICWGFFDRYIWLVEDGFGAPGYMSVACDRKPVQVARGGRADYHHVLGTLFVKIGPRTR